MILDSGLLFWATLYKESTISTPYLKSSSLIAVWFSELCNGGFSLRNLGATPLDEGVGYIIWGTEVPSGSRDKVSQKLKKMLNYCSNVNVLQ